MNTTKNYRAWECNYYTAPSLPQTLHWHCDVPHSASSPQPTGQREGRLQIQILGLWALLISIWRYLWTLKVPGNLLEVHVGYYHLHRIAVAQEPLSLCLCNHCLVVALGGPCTSTSKPPHVQAANPEIQRV